MEKFSSYLTTLIKAVLKKDIQRPINICLGNVSADMDSVVGSMALSYYYHLRNKDDVFVPVVNSKKEAFFVKLE